MTAYAANIERRFRSATLAEREKGELWYRQAHSLARLLAVVARTSVDQAAGVLAVLSPLSRWDHNVTKAFRLARGVENSVGCTRVNRDKAIRILAGEPVAAVLSGRKVHAFWEGIRDPLNCARIAVDRHLYRAALDDAMAGNLSPAPSAREFSELEAAYLRAAADLDLPATAVAATVWLVMRRLSAPGQRAISWSQQPAGPPACRHCRSPHLIGHGPRRRACKDCGRTTTVTPRPRGRRVELPGSWPGPITEDSRGRLRIFLGKGHPIANSGGWQYLSRFIVWREIGVVLRSDEHVHHEDGDQRETSPEKLRVVLAEYHGRLHASATLLWRKRSADGRFEPQPPTYPIPRYRAIIGKAALAHG